jgi:hypothetical protein
MKGDETTAEGGLAPKLSVDEKQQQHRARNEKEADDTKDDDGEDDDDEEEEEDELNDMDLELEASVVEPELGEDEFFNKQQATSNKQQATSKQTKTLTNETENRHLGQPKWRTSRFWFLCVCFFVGPPGGTEFSKIVCALLETAKKGL